MPDSNDPYSRPVNATKAHHALVGTHYGSPSTYSARAVAAGNAMAAAAAPYRGGPAVPEGFEAPKSKRKGKPQDPESLPLATPNPDVASPSDDEPSPSDDQEELVITEEDLFG